ncbi:MAG: hypothetical protein AAF363_00060 [Bacteroidota bacterium]
MASYLINKALLALTLVITTSIVTASPCQESNNKYEIYYTPEQFIPKIDFLREVYGKQKNIPETIELAALVALSKFPELKDAKINFVIKTQQEVMYMQPSPAPFMSPKENRTFTVYVTDNNDVYEALVLSEIPFNALVGVIGHELSHVVDFYTKSKANFFFDNFRYALSKKHRAKVERTADIMTLNHGLGYQLAHMREVYDQYLIVLPKTTRRLQHKSYLTYKEIIGYLEEGKEISKN